MEPEPRVSYTAAMAAMAACDWCRALELLEEMRLKQMFPTVAGIHDLNSWNSRPYFAVTLPLLLHVSFCDDRSVSAFSVILDLAMHKLWISH